MKYSNRLSFMTKEDHQNFQQFGNKARISNDSIEFMNKSIINNINLVVGEKDELYCLGDWCFSSRDNYLKDAKRYREQIQCQNVYLIWGNHDQFSLRRSVDFASCMDTCKVEADGYEFFLSHYPHLSWDKSHRGVMHLYGHVHALYHENPPVLFPESWAAHDVGVDVEQRYGVWSATEIAQRLHNKVQAAKLRRD